MISKLKKKIFTALYDKRDYKKQLEINEHILKKLKFNLFNIKRSLKNSGYDYNDSNLSWHYHLFSGFSSTKKKKILEIGTYDGQFASFLSRSFTKSEIITCDLDNKNFFFNNTYKRENKTFLKKFLKKRKYNIYNKNIKFLKLDSINLIDNFKFNSFDYIWIDGNHLGPQVQFDIFQSLKLLKKGGYFIIDDVIKKNFKHKYGSTESYKTLKFLEKMHNIKTHYIYKRLWYKNLYQEKFISISKL